MDKGLYHTVPWRPRERFWSIGNAVENGKVEGFKVGKSLRFAF